MPRGCLFVCPSLRHTADVIRCLERRVIGRLLGAVFSAGEPPAWYLYVSSDMARNPDEGAVCATLLDVFEHRAVCQLDVLPCATLHLALVGSLPLIGKSLRVLETNSVASNRWHSGT